MKNKNKGNATAPGASQKQHEKKVPVKKLPRMQMYAVLGLELGKKIFEKLEEVEKSVDFIAAQKQRELNPDEPQAQTSE